MPTLLAILALPLAEIAGLIFVGSRIGVAATLLLVVAAAALGVALLRGRGLAAIAGARASVDRGEPPIGPLVDMAAIAFAGILLIVPGFITDIGALLLLLPPTRRAATAWALRHVEIKGARFTASEGRATVIDGEWTEVRTSSDHRVSHRPGPRP